MRRKNQTILGMASALLDIALTLLAYLLAVVLRFRVLDGYVSIAMASGPFIAVILVYALIVVLLYAGFHLYQPFRLSRPVRDAGVVTAVNSIAVLALMSFFFTFKVMDFSRGALVLFWAISSAFVILKIVWMDKARHAMRNQDRYLRRVIVVGSGRSAQRFIREVREKPQLGLKIRGFVGGGPDKKIGNYLGGYEALAAILEKSDCDELVVALEPQEISFMPGILMAAEKEGVRVEMIPMYCEYYPSHPTIESIGETKLVDLRATPLDNIALAALKRLGDILGSAFLLIVLSPFMLLIALGVRLSSPGPVLFKQERVGKDKKPFIMLKFRSMRADTDHSGWTTDRDPRKTRFGSFIRKFSLDELPQLINVLTGEMSLVGPRPELPVFVQQFKEEVPLYLIRQQVRPGMTGWAQINGLRGDTSIEKRVVYDIWYIQNWSLGLDLKIIWKTAFGGMKNSEKLV